MGPEKAEKYRFIGWLSASACAEVIADVFLCPMEAAKVRIQTSPPGSFPLQLRKALPLMWSTEGVNGFYKGISPLWAR